MDQVDMNELSDRITVRLAGMNERRRRRRFYIAILSLLSVLTTMLFAAALIWFLTD